jgi:hypothetical protein
MPFLLQLRNLKMVETIDAKFLFFNPRFKPWAM